MTATIDLNQTKAFGPRAAVALSLICAREDGLLEGAQRTEEWSASMRRADIIPTGVMVEKICGVAKLVGSEVNIFETLRAVDERPYGETARRFYDEFDVSPPGFDKPFEDYELSIAAGLDPIVKSVRNRDRLVLTSPLQRSFGVLLFQIFLALEFTTSSVAVSLPSALGTAAAINLMLVGNLQRFEAWLSKVCVLSRGPKTTALFNSVCERRRREGLATEYGHCWYQPEDGPHLIPAYRNHALGSGALSDLYERLLVLLAANGGLAVVLFAIFQFAGEPSAAIAFVAVIVVLLAAGLWVKIAAVGQQEKHWHELTVGLGLPKKS